jgi:hypothetical protein
MVEKQRIKDLAMLFYLFFKSLSQDYKNKYAELSEKLVQNEKILAESLISRKKIPKTTYNFYVDSCSEMGNEIVKKKFKSVILILSTIKIFTLLFYYLKITRPFDKLLKSLDSNNKEADRIFHNYRSFRNKKSYGSITRTVKVIFQLNSLYNKIKKDVLTSLPSLLVLYVLILGIIGIFSPAFSIVVYVAIFSGIYAEYRITMKRFFNGK